MCLANEKSEHAHLSSHRSSNMQPTDGTQPGHKDTLQSQSWGTAQRNSLEHQFQSLYNSKVLFSPQATKANLASSSIDTSYHPWQPQQHDAPRPEIRQGLQERSINKKNVGLFKGRVFFEELSCSIHIDPTKMHLLTLACFCRNIPTIHLFWSLVPKLAFIHIQ